jgi:predicted nucleic acid-binding protein
MFLLDTNVLSALMSLAPPPPVALWIAGRSIGSLFTVSVCQAEILAGIALLPTGRRRAGIEEAARAVFMEDFDGRVLPFDSAAATVYADIFAARRQAGRPIATVDLMIAAVARAQGASVVTRDAGGFEGCGLTVINPWQS